MFDDEAFVDFITGLGLRFFRPYEFLVMGGRHSDPNSPAYGKNSLPPQDLWRNIADTARVLDRLRLRLDSPIRISNAYRTKQYNQLIGGAKQSQHLVFNALDFVVEGNSRPSHWARALRSIRNDDRAFKGGVGLYDTFVHVDTRGHNVDW
jgi:hypothetical protein